MVLMRTVLRNRKGVVRAILAGGVVLGVGAAITLAAWNASDFATGTFKSGTFALEGSIDDTTFAAHPAAPGAALSFTAPVADLSPNDVVYSSYCVRLAAGTTANATVTVNTGTPTGSLAGLTYSLVQTTGTTCDATTTGTSLVPSGTALGTVPGAPTFALSAGSPTTSAGTAVHLCFTVTAAAGLAQGLSGTATWQFAAQSN